VGTGVQCLSMPRLVSVGGTLTIDANPVVVRSEIESLESAGGIVVTGNAALPSLELSSLRTINGELTVRDNAALKSIVMESLTTVTGCIDVSTAQCTEPPNLANASCCENGQQLISDNACAECS
jgi:hypothetical protein